MKFITAHYEGSCSCLNVAIAVCNEVVAIEGPVTGSRGCVHLEEGGVSGGEGERAGQLLLIERVVEDEGREGGERSSGALGVAEPTHGS